MAYEEHNATDKQIAATMQGRAGGRTSVPQIFIDGQHIGGYAGVTHLSTAVL